MQAGPPATAHVEALLRGVAVRSATLSSPVETLVVPVPWKSATVPPGAWKRTPVRSMTALRHWPESRIAISTERCPRPVPSAVVKRAMRGPRPWSR